MSGFWSGCSNRDAHPSPLKTERLWHKCQCARDKALGGLEGTPEAQGWNIQ